MSQTVKRVLDTCKGLDKDAQMLNYTISNHLTVVRLRSSSGTGATSELAKGLLRKLPFSRTAVTTNLLDGSLETTVEVGSQEHERRSARVLASRGRLPSVLNALSLLFLVAGGVLLLVGGALVASRHFQRGDADIARA